MKIAKTNNMVKMKRNRVVQTLDFTEPFKVPLFHPD